MATSGGPNIETDGLVFGYDTGYPVVSGSSDTYRFNLGEPTENLISQMAGSTDFSYPEVLFRCTAIETNITDSTAPGGKYSRFIGQSLGNESNNQVYSRFNTAGIDVRNSTITYSVYLKGSGTCHLTVYADNASYGTSSTITLTDTWTRYTYTRAVTDYTTNCWVAVRGVLPTTDVYIASQQAEINSHPTPFTTGTRSVSGSLLDLKGNTDIDLSNVSFDSNAQMTFDGTDDVGIVSNFSINSNYTYEGVFYINPADSGYSGFFSNMNSPLGISGVGNGWLLRIEPNGSLQLYVKDNSSTYNRPINVANFRSTYAGQTLHIVYTCSTTYNAVYVNGELLAEHTGVSSGTIPSDSQLLFGAYDWGIVSQRFYLTGKGYTVKAYNRALTPSEVQQNFKAYKNRFNL